MKNFKEFRNINEELALQEAFKLTKSNYVKIKNHFKLMDELIKFVVKKGGHVPTNQMKRKLDVSKPKGFNIPEFGSLIQSLNYSGEGGMNDLDPKTDPWTNKMAKVKIFNKKDGLQLADEDADYDDHYNDDDSDDDEEDEDDYNGEHDDHQDEHECA